uniref:Uncharacterized protein n=1 Tax=Tanacetum cinerariifolium TaxID=118510 RepID=A0A699KUN1_TANCI|nr:hypothetical protein [Tanacetum cinerariifolium]
MPRATIAPKYSPPPDLRDPLCHSPPRVATTFKPTITTATVTLTPPSPPRHHQEGAFYFIKHKCASGLSQHHQGKGCVRLRLQHQPWVRWVRVKITSVRVGWLKSAKGAFGSGFNTIEAALDLMAALGCDWLG